MVLKLIQIFIENCFCYLPYSGSIHDGAVVIDNRKYRCRVLLTLKETLIFQETWYCHRAAIGVTEGRDSIAVVSEETNQVSICVCGKTLKLMSF